MVEPRHEGHDAFLHALETGRPVLDGIVEWMQEGVVLHDVDGRIIEATSAACQLLGLSEDQLLGRDSLHPEWSAIDRWGAPLPGDQHPVAIARRTGRPAKVVMGVRRPGLPRVWLKVSAVPLPVEGLEHPMVVVTFVDVSDKITTLHRLVESEERFRLTLQFAPIGMAIVELDGTFSEVNPALADMLGMTPEELRGRTFQELTHPDDLDGDLALVASLLDGRLDSYTMDKRYLAVDGSVVWAHLAVALIRSSEGEPLHFVSQIEDVTDAHRTKELLEERALFDALSGLANRALVADRVQQAVIRNRQVGHGLALLCCGIDGLKRINDSLGHGAGDALIAAVGARIVEAVGAPEHVGRGDGDEFFVLVEDLAPTEVPLGLIARLQEVVSRPLDVQGHELRPAVSIGVALRDGEPVGADLLHDATTALLEAKARGRGEWALFDRQTRARAVQRLTVESELEPAIARGEFELFYQPIVDLVTRRPVAFEALARWRHPDLGLLLPDRFIPVAEETGLIDRLGANLVDQACAFLGQHPEPGVQVFVNVSPSQLGPGSFAAVVAAALDRHGVDPSRLGLELTETSVLHATGRSYRALQELGELGVDLVLDDFGTGYSAVAALLAAPIRGIKLDRSFTSRLGVDPQADMVTQALGGMVEALGFSGVVEGVETEAQRDAVVAHGWKYGQGWLFGHPLPADQVDVGGR